MKRETHPARDIGNPIARSMLLLFVLPSMTTGFMHIPDGTLQGVYAKYGGIALQTLALAVLLTRIFDAVTYPLIGYLSDKWFARTGTRKPWVVAGALISVVGCWFLYRPPQHVTILYYGICVALAYVGWKIAEIPYAAWSYGLSRDYVQRPRIQLWRSMALLFGQMLFYATPFLAMRLGVSTSSEVNFNALGVAAIACVIAVPLSSLVVVLFVPDGEASRASVAERQRFTLTQTLDAIRRNGPLLRLLAAFFPMSIVFGMATGVAFLFMDAFLKLGKMYAAISMVGLLMSLIGMPLWGWLSMRFERHRVWALSLVTCAVAFSGMAFLSPGPEALPGMFILYPLTVLCYMGTFLVFAMIGDIADFGRFQSGEDLSGMYSSVIIFIQKSITSVSVAAGLALVSWFGFDPTAAVQSASGAFGIRLVFVILPAIGLASGAAIMWSFPLDRKRLEEVREALAARAAGA